MRRPDPLPSSLRGRSFTRAEALDVGVSPERLRRRDIERIGRGRYRWIDSTDLVAGNHQHPDRARDAPRPARGQALEPRRAAARRRDDVLMARAASILDEVTDACASHLTAARVRRWWLPDHLRDGTEVHVIRPPGSPRLDRDSVTTHRMRLLDDDVVRYHGRRVTSVERTWLDCVELLSVDDLVVLGDTLVRVPHSWAEPGVQPWTTPDRLRGRLDRSTGRRGITSARRALSGIRIGADSPQESMLRLALVEAGLPEPLLQVECWDPEYATHFPATADLGYPELKVAIQYEGEHHGSPEQLRRDLRRDQAFARQGWTVLRFGSSDSAERFRSAVTLVRQALAAASSRRTP